MLEVQQGFEMFEVLAWFLDDRGVSKAFKCLRCWQGYDLFEVLANLCNVSVLAMPSPASYPMQTKA